MNLFEGIGFENFKVFGSETYFHFAPITILTGTNNSGKSSVLNGIRLLQENFKHIKKTYKSNEELSLEKIMTSKIDTGDMLQRYGTLQQFVSKGSNLNEFNFFFRREMEAIEDVAEIKFLVKINDNNIKNGTIANLKMTAVRSQNTFFEIKSVAAREASPFSTSNREKYVIKIDFNYFFEKTMLRISDSIEYFQELHVISTEVNKLSALSVTDKLEKSIDEFNTKYKVAYSLILNKGNLMLHDINDEEPSFVITINELNDIIKEQSKLISLHDFSYALSENIEDKNVFEKIITGYYSTSLSDASLRFTKDCLDFLSDVEWYLPDDSLFYDPGIDFILQQLKGGNGVGLQKFIELFTNFSVRPNEMGSFRDSKLFAINESAVSVAILKHEQFYKNLFVPLLEKLATNLSESDRSDMETNKYLQVNPFKKIKPSKIGRSLSSLIYQNILLAQSCIDSFQLINFLPTNRIQSKRTYSFSDSDDFTILVKKLENLKVVDRKEAYDFINRWLKLFGIADEFFIRHDTETGSFKPFLRNQHDELLLPDFGYGTSQIIPLLLKIIPENNPDHEFLHWEPEFNSRVVVIEEPEVNLHPALQSKLADLFVEATKKFDIQIIVETHSEYLIRKLQYLTAKGDITPSVTQLYYFYHPDKIPNGEEQIKKINVNKDGSLTDNFGEGFFDEADNIALELFLISQGQKN